jgi:hypothetical protein
MNIIGLIESVRNKILNFVLEIETEAPDAGEAQINTQPMLQDKIHHIFNTYITGSVQNLSTGSSNFTQMSTINSKGSLSELHSILSENNVPKADIEELFKAIEKDKKNEPEKNGFGKKVTGWMTKMIQKASSGVWKLSISTATSVITKAISSFYGLE